jgi:hypothetical protein
MWSASDFQRSDEYAADMSDAPAELSTRYWRRWYAYAYFAAGWLFFPSIYVAIPLGFENSLIYLWMPWFLLALPVGLWTFMGYIEDATELKDVEADWVPKWWAWALGHVLLSPLFTAPIYLLQRTSRTGLPWNNGYTIRG